MPEAISNYAAPVLFVLFILAVLYRLYCVGAIKFRNMRARQKEADRKLRFKIIDDVLKRRDEEISNAQRW